MKRILNITLLLTFVIAVAGSIITLLLTFVIAVAGSIPITMAGGSLPAMTAQTDTAQIQVMTASLADWFTWDTLLYLVIVILGGFLTIVAAKHRAVIREMRELAEAVRAGYADNKLTDAERKHIMKEALDVIGALIKVAWRPAGIAGTTVKKMVSRR